MAGYLKVAQSYPEPGRFPSFDFTIYPGEISRINDSRLAQERLGYVLSERVQKGLRAEKLGRDYLTEMKSAGVLLLSYWQQAKTQEPAFPSTLIHNDLFADNYCTPGNFKEYLFRLPKITSRNFFRKATFTSSGTIIDPPSDKTIFSFSGIKF